MDEASNNSKSEQRLEELAAFHEIGKALTSTLNRNQVLEIIMEKISSLFHPHTWSLLLIDEVTGELYFEIVTGEAAESLKEVRLKPGEGIAGWVATRGEPLVLADAYRDPHARGRAHRYPDAHAYGHGHLYAHRDGDGWPDANSHAHLHHYAHAHPLHPAALQPRLAGCGWAL